LGWRGGIGCGKANIGNRWGELNGESCRGEEELSSQGKGSRDEAPSSFDFTFDKKSSEPGRNIFAEGLGMKKGKEKPDENSVEDRKEEKLKTLFH